MWGQFLMSYVPQLGAPCTQLAPFGDTIYPSGDTFTRRLIYTTQETTRNGSSEMKITGKIFTENLISKTEFCEQIFWIISFLYYYTQVFINPHGHSLLK